MSEKKSIRGPIIDPAVEAEEITQLERKLQEAADYVSLALSRLPPHIKVAQPGAPRAALNLRSDPPALNPKCVVVAPIYEGSFPYRNYALWHVSLDGVWTPEDRGPIRTRKPSTRVSVIARGFELIESGHDLTVVHSTIHSKPVGPGMAREIVECQPDMGSASCLQWIVADGGPLDPGRHYIVQISDRFHSVTKFGNRSTATEAALPSVSPGGADQLFGAAALWFRHNTTIADLPADAPNLPPWIYGEGFIPETGEAALRHRLNFLKSQHEDRARQRFEAAGEKAGAIR